MTILEVPRGATLADLFAFDRMAQGVEAIREAAAQHLQDVDAKHASLLGRSLADWRAASLTDELVKAFAIDPFALMAKAWSQAAKLRQAAQESRGPPPKPTHASVLKHEIDAKLAPRLVLGVAGVDWCDVAFEAKLALGIESADLEFFGGSLVSVGLGQATGSLTLACEGTPIHVFKRALRFAASYPIALPKPGPDGSEASMI